MVDCCGTITAEHNSTKERSTERVTQTVNRQTAVWDRGILCSCSSIARRVEGAEQPAAQRVNKTESARLSDYVGEGRPIAYGIEGGQNNNNNIPEFPRGVPVGVGIVRTLRSCLAIFESKI